MDSTTSEQARINARLPKEQKQFLEKAAYLGGFRNLTDFIFQAAQEKANEIIQEKEPDIASEIDAQTFIEAITNPKSPSDNLKKALKDYQHLNATIQNK
jgi:uncharacterized protein (DUF1778 family)